MKIKIIEAKKEHLDVIIELYGELLNFHQKIDKYYKSANAKNKKEFKKYLVKIFGKKNCKIFLALYQQKVIGYFIGKIEKPKLYALPQKIGKITSAFVLKKYRRKKIGQKMFTKLLKWFQKNKIKHIEISVDARNQIGLMAWKKFGFFEFQKKMRFDLL